MNAAKFQNLMDWLIDGARSHTDPKAMMAECCERLIAAGIPLWRVGVFIRTLHPDFLGMNFVWKPGAEVEVGTADFDFLESERFTSSPLKIVFEQGIEVRGHTEDPQARRFPIIPELAAEGVTDYIALPLLFMDRSINASSWTTKQEGGFTDEQLAALRTFIPALARYCEITQSHRIATTLLDTYVGNRAGTKILGGQIRRGHTESMHAAIWLSDLRGFTALSDRLPAETVVEILNQYFDCQVTAIRNHGGEVLKYMGDGLLAVFPIDEYVGDSQQVCSRVLEAARGGHPRQRAGHGVRGRRDQREIPLRRRPACRADPLRQYRRRQPARLHLYRPGGESRGAAGEDRRTPASHHRGLGRFCRHLQRRLARSRRVSDRRIFKGRAGLRPDRRNAGGLIAFAWRVEQNPGAP